MSSNNTDSLMLAYIHILEAEVARLRLQKASLGIKTKTRNGQQCVIIQDYQRSRCQVIPIGSLHVRFMYGNYDHSAWTANGPSVTGAGIDLVAHEAPSDGRTWFLEVVEFRLCQSATHDTYKAVITYDNDKKGVTYISAHPLGEYIHDMNYDHQDIMYNDINAMAISDAYAHRILTEFITGGASIHVRILLCDHA